MRLESDAIEWHARGLQRLHKVEERRRLRARILDVVLVDVQLRIRIRRARSLERDLDVGRAEGVVEDVRATGAVVVEGLIDDVPAVDLALIVAYQSGAVVLDDGRKLGCGEAAAGDPAG